jgi:molecular chaperone IbpA
MNDSYTIEFALAGWKMDDLKIELEKNVLTVSGNNDTLETDYERQQEFVHRGIANRSFTNQFTIGDRVQVDSAQLNDGMLIIGLTVVIPEEDRPLTIPINSTNELLIES